MTDHPSRAIALAQPLSAIPSESEFAVMQRMALVFEKSGLYKNVANVAQAIAIVQTGRELGIGPSMALREMYIIPGQGRPTLSAALLAAVVQRDHGDDALRVVESTNEVCRVRYRRRSWDTAQEIAFTIEDARRAGLVKGGSNWEKYPRAMCRSRAISEACRAGFSDSIMGLHTTEELAPDLVTVTPEGEVIVDGAATPAAPPATRAAIQTATGRTVNATTGEIVDAPPTSGPMEPLNPPSSLTPRQQLEVRIAQADTLSLLQQVWKDVCAASTKGTIDADDRTALVVAKDQRKAFLDLRARIDGAADTAALMEIQSAIDAAAIGHVIDEPAAELLTDLVTERGGQVPDQTGDAVETADVELAAVEL